MGILAVGRYGGISGAPAFLEVHELLSDDAMVVAASGSLMSTTLRALERFGATILAAARPVRPAGPAPAPWDRRGSTADLSPGDRRAGGRPRVAPGLQIGRIDIPPAHEDEFNE